MLWHSETTFIPSTIIILHMPICMFHFAPFAQCFMVETGQATLNRKIKGMLQSREIELIKMSTYGSLKTLLSMCFFNIVAFDIVTEKFMKLISLD